MQHDKKNSNNHFHKGASNRLEDAESFDVEDDSSHLWAVSYADFLMVLLSFFVIFFSLDKEEKEKVKNQIVQNQTFLKLENDLLKRSKPVGSSDNQETTAENPNKRTLASVVERFNVEESEIEINKTDYPREIQIFLPDNIFDLNAVHINARGIKSLKKVLYTLEPYGKHLEITFIGHSDSSKVRPRKEKLISNNFALSSLRASQALVKALEFGFPASSLNVLGQADFERNSRTLSVLVKAKEEQQ